MKSLGIRTIARFVITAVTFFYTKKFGEPEAAQYFATREVPNMKTKKRFLLTGISVGFICTLFLLSLHLQSQFSPVNKPWFMPEPVEPAEIQCFNYPSTDDSFPDLDSSIEQELLLSSRRNIFFLETSCFEEKGGYAKLNYRQACSVEAAARTNPNMSVNLFYLSPAPPSSLTRRLMKHLLEYNNVRVNRIRVAEYIQNTPLEDWYASGVLTTSRWPNIHMSDFLRLLTLWKYGGIYLDLDVVLTSSLEDLTNFVGFHSNLTANSAILGFTVADLGFQIASKCLQNLMDTYSGSSWDGSSCGVLNRITQEWCKTDIMEEMTIDRCGGFQVCPPSTFYPVHWREKERAKLFNTEHAAKTMRLINAARGVHMWNSMTEHTKVSKGSPYAQIAKKYCPSIYSDCDGEF